MFSPLHPLIRSLEQICARFGLGMRAKLITLFVFIKVIPLVLLALLAWKQAWHLGDDLRQRTELLSNTAIQALEDTGEISIGDTAAALDTRAREDIERMTTDTANRVASFLYARDADILLAATLTPDAETYAKFLQQKRGMLIRPGIWKLSDDKKSWEDVTPTMPPGAVSSSNDENTTNFHYRAPDQFGYEQHPLYLEMTFVDLQGRELVKAVTSPRMDPQLKDVSRRSNTYTRAETYFSALKDLRPGEIYVSDVIGPYVRSRVIGAYTPANAAKAGEDFAPEKSAFAGKENPLGIRFQGIIRWATPVESGGEIIGYVTLALDHDHLMKFTDHQTPMPERYTRVSDAGGGNYAFIWDHKGRNIVHPRHFSITGYDPESGDPEIPWLEGPIYDAWQASGKSYAEFIPTAPTFLEQSNKKKPAPQLTKQGLVGLDCRYLNFAPQCTGWFDLTRDGGSGSFLISWSGLWKLTTAAAIPYYTGQYGASPRGFGFVTIGAEVADFHMPATRTKKTLDALFAQNAAVLEKTQEEANDSITSNLRDTTYSLTLATSLMVVVVVLIAIWLASAFTRSITSLIAGISRFRSGERHFRFHAPVKDELGTLADSFDDMADSLVESVKDPLTIVDMRRNVRYMNEAGLRLIGVSLLTEILGKPYAQHSLYPEGSAYCPLTSLMQGVEAAVFFHEPSGRHYKGTAGFLTDKHGEHAGYVIVTTDYTTIISEQQQHEKQRAMLHTIFTSSPDLIWFKDDKGRYLVANPRFESLFTKQPGDYVGLTDDERYPPIMAAHSVKMDAAVMQSGLPVYTEEVLIFADGHSEVADVVRTPVCNSAGEYQGLLGVARDVTRRVEFERELRDTQMALENAVERANRASQAKSSFLARMSHEIRTPLGAIIGMTNIVKRKLGQPLENAEKIRSHVQQIETSSQHLMALLNDVLDISKIEAGKIELSADKLHLPSLLGNVVSIISPRCTENNLHFDVRIGHIHPVAYICDALRLRQVLINLLGNAVKFTPASGTVTFSVSQLEYKDGRSLIHFTVRDSGIGIANDALDKLFAPFEQAHAGIAKQYGGSGLGLSICSNIVEMMGGAIDVQSEEGKGATFSFAIWLKEAQESQDPAVASPQAREVSLAGKRALLVDDVMINRLIVVELLADTGLQIDEAEDGQEGIDAFAASAPGYYDIIFMDAQMPNVDGYEATRAIRVLERSDAQTVPIVAMTANAFKEDIEKALDSGMNAHLAKPLELDKLNEVLAKYLGGVMQSY